MQNTMTLRTQKLASEEGVITGRGSSTRRRSGGREGGGGPGGGKKNGEVGAAGPKWKIRSSEVIKFLEGPVLK